MKNENFRYNSYNSRDSLHGGSDIRSSKEKVKAGIKKSLAFVSLFSLLFVIVCVPAFALNEGAYIHTVGAYDGLGLSGSFGSQYGKYGGFSILPAASQFVNELWNYEIKQDFTGIKFTVILDLQANVPVNILMPYEYVDSSVNQMLSGTYDETASRGLTANGVLSVNIGKINAGAGQYIAFYQSNRYTYDLDSSTQCLRFQVKASETGQYAVFFDVNFKGAATPAGASGIANAVDLTLNNAEAFSVLSYISTMLSYSWIQVLAYITVVALLLGVIANWSQSL